jgi:hypothetical protein
VAGQALAARSLIPPGGVDINPERKLMTYQSRTRTLISGIAASLIALAAPAAAGAQPEVFTQVDHDVTLASEFFPDNPDDICGGRAVTETVTNEVQVDHLTANEDGSFHFVDFETGTLVADYVDPSIPDQTMRRTNTEVFNLTPGGTFTHTETISQFDSTIRITATVHLTIVDGEPKVAREVTMVRGCP